MLRSEFLATASEIDKPTSPIKPSAYDSGHVTGYKSCCCDAAHCSLMELSHGSHTDRLQSTAKKLIVPDGSLTLTE